jgi:transcriptional regulator with XRE-family HTH domain
MYQTPQQIADRIEEIRDNSHAKIADHLGVDRSAVSHALNDPSSRRIKLLAQIAGLYGIDVDPDHVAYAVSEDSVNQTRSGT